MKKINNVFRQNPYLANCRTTIFTMLVGHATAQREDLKHLSKLQYIHGLLQYPKWTATSDIFQYLSKKMIGALRKRKLFFVFDSSTEGFSPTIDFPFFEMLYYNCEKYNIRPSQIIYVSSNLRDEENIKSYAAEHQKVPFRVFSFVSFEQVLTLDDKHGKGIIDVKFNDAKTRNALCFKQHYYSSLSRVNRQWRTYGTFMLWNSDVRDKGLISHNTYKKVDGVHTLRSLEVPDEDGIKFLNSLPLIVDQRDFNNNWAINTEYQHIHDQTIFQIVNETLVEDHNNTTLFYSEKTFRPVAYFQPMLIWGQPGINKYLSKIGYKTYDDWFDLSFDDEPDHKLRYQKLLKVVEDTCNKLDNMTDEQKIEWRFKNEEVLKHNFETMTKSTYSKEKLNNFLKGLA